MSLGFGKVGQCPVVRTITLKSNLYLDALYRIYILKAGSFESSWFRADSAFGSVKLPPN